MKTLSTYIEEQPILEMATMNLSTPSSGPLPSNKYKVEMYSNDHTPPHVHILYDGCNIEFYIETGEFYKYKKNSKELNIKEFNKLCSLFKDWLINQKKYNQSYQKICFLQWTTWFGDEEFSKEFIDKMSK